MGYDMFDIVQQTFVRREYPSMVSCVGARVNVFLFPALFKKDRLSIFF